MTRGRSTRRALATAAGISALVLVAGTTVALRGDIDWADHERYSVALRQALELDARLGEEVAKARLGMVTHYDDLVRVRDRITANEAQLLRIPAAIDGDRRALLEQELEVYRDAVEEEELLVERLKTDHAVLRNSLRALPHNVHRLLASTPAEATDLREAVAGLLRDSLLLVLGPHEPSRARAVQCGLERLGRPAGCGVPVVDRSTLSPATRDRLASVTSHAETILLRSDALGGLMDQLMTVPVAAHGRRARDTYAELFERAAAEARMRWLIVGLAAIALLLFASAFIIARLQASALALRDTKAALEAAMEAIERERDREVELANLKSRFVSMTSHEFRTPLSVILSSAELLEAYGASWDDARKGTHLGRIQEAAQKMSRMLDGVLLIGRAESGMLRATPRRIRPADLAATVVDEVRAVVGPDRRLEYEQRGDPRELWLDDNLLRHVLTNLLSNAFKYSPDHSTVHFVVQQEAEGVLFEVADEGIGIPEDELEGLFEAFHRCSNASAIPGTGLGLAVVKKSLDVHRGTIDVESHIGRGTRFAVRVPELEEEAA